MKRSIVLRRTEVDDTLIDQLAQRHELTVVYTAITDTTIARMAVMIAVEHALDHRAEAVIVPHLTAEDVWDAREWRALGELWDVVISDGTVIDGDPDFARS